MIRWAKLGEHAGCGRWILSSVSVCKDPQNEADIFGYWALLGGERLPLNLIRGVLPRLTARRTVVTLMVSMLQEQ